MTQVETLTSACGLLYVQQIRLHPRGMGPPGPGAFPDRPARHPGRPEPDHRGAEEGSAVSEAVARAAENPHSAPLLASLLHNLQASRGQLAQPPEPLHPADAQAVALRTLERVVTLLARKAAPAEARAFKEWLLEIARATAQAAKEGGVLGIGGVQVNAAEEAALEQIRTVLGF
jgi:hypothetical protein